MLLQAVILLSISHSAFTSGSMQAVLVYLLLVL